MIARVAATLLVAAFLFDDASVVVAPAFRPARRSAGLQPCPWNDGRPLITSSPEGLRYDPTATAAAVAAQGVRPARDTRSLRPSGTQWIDADGKPFAWRGITAFRLL